MPAPPQHARPLKCLRTSFAWLGCRNTATSPGGREHLGQLFVGIDQDEAALLSGCARAAATSSVSTGVAGCRGRAGCLGDGLVYGIAQVGDPVERLVVSAGRKCSIASSSSAVCSPARPAATGAAAPYAAGLRRRSPVERVIHLRRCRQHCCRSLHAGDRLLRAASTACVSTIWMALFTGLISKIRLHAQAIASS